MRAESAFVPAHISGFFEPCDAEDPRRVGSRNCGPCIEPGVLTKVITDKSKNPSLKIRINGANAEAITTRSVVEQVLELTRGHFEIEIDHICQVPIGAGFGASGAGALGAALALSKSLGLKMSRDEILTIAHVAEVTCRTGLGDVGAQNLGGLVIGVRPGAPPWGKWKNINVPGNLRVICCTLGPLSTPKLLREADFRMRAKNLAIHAMKKIMRSPTPWDFMEVSTEFSERLGLLDDELRTLISDAKKAGAIGASQVMLGRAVFALVEREKMVRVRSALLKSRAESLIISKIARKGAKLF